VGLKGEKVKTQRVVSLSLGLVFIIMFLASGVLYFIPDRRVTNWSGWSFLGLDKQQWDNLHINLGILFLVLLVWHIYYNWKPIKNYLKEKKKFILFTKEFNLSLLLVSLFIVGTIWMLFPLSFLVNIGNGVKAFNALDRGNSPFAYAEETTLRDYAILTGIEHDHMVENLKRKGIIFKETQTVKKVAKENGLTPDSLSYIIETKCMKRSLPSDLPVGIAHKSLGGLASTYKIDLERFIMHLKYYHIKAESGMMFKKLAKENHLHPATLYNMLLASQMKIKE
jgi:lambda repressor-like predicted transcriptional regulator/cytochrome b561